MFWYFIPLIECFAQRWGFNNDFHDIKKVENSDNKLLSEFDIESSTLRENYVAPLYQKNIQSMQNAIWENNIHVWFSVDEC